ncbi:MAG: IspD/TarI family cytidylyltransferase, partial [Planktomarina sp.]
MAYPGSMQSEPKIAAIILCAGQGTRAGGQVAKQWQPLAGKRVIDWVITRFDQHPKIDVMVIVHPNGEGHHFTDNPSHLKYVVGGDSRSQSVCNGLAALETTAPDLVLIHDGARPCVTDEIIDVCIEHLNHHTAVAPAVAVTDTLWMGENGMVGDVVDRSALFQAQTP